MEIRFVTLTLLVVLAACGRSSPRGTVEAVRPFPTEYRSGSRLLVVASDFRSGRLDVVPLVGSLRVLEAMTVHQDSVVRSYPGASADFVVQRTASSLRLIAKRDGRPLSEIPLPACNPQDVIPVSSGQVYVSCFEGIPLRRVNLSTGAVVARISLPEELSVPGQPPGATLFGKLPDGRVLVQVQRLSNGISPSTESYIAIVDPRTNRVELPARRLQRTNPVTDFKTGPDGAAYLGEAGYQGFEMRLDGGIERYDTRSLIARETELRGDIVDFEVLADERAVAIVTDAQYTYLKRFTPGNGFATDVTTLLRVPKYDLPQLVLHRAADELYVPDRNSRRPGIRVYRASTLVELRFIPMTFPPFRMTLMQ